MKRALAVLITLLIAPALFAQTDRAMLLAPNGTLYSVQSFANGPADDPSIKSMRYLQLTAQTGSNVLKMNVPASVTGGNNWQPALAFDAESNTLFVVWLRSPYTILATNELLFCTFQNGRWTDASSIEDAPFHFRYNLRVGVTRTFETQEDATGALKQVPALTVHAAWWDVSGDGEAAHYAMMSIDRGIVKDVQHRTLFDFIDSANLKYYDIDDASREILRHPAISESIDHQTIDVVFGDMVTNSLHRVTLKPVLQTRVRIPIGVRDTSYPVPHNRVEGDAVISTMSTTPDRLVLYYIHAGQLNYMKFENGEWSDNSVVLTPEVSADAAIGALRRMVSGD